MDKKFWLIGAVVFVAVAVWLGKQWYLAPALSLGSTAPDFSAPKIDGSTFQLSSLRGKVVLLDFWASWCGPCRKDNPALVRIWQEYSGKPFEIVSISLDEQAQAWQRAIQKDGLVWQNHISNLKGFDEPVAILYGVKSIPTKYLLGEDGSILAVNPNEDKLRALLKSRLK